MKVVIQVAAEDDAKAWALMVRHSPGVALPNRTFVVSEELVHALRDAGIHFKELPHDAETQVTGLNGVLTGERI
jgi:hypothetical protein